MGEGTKMKKLVISGINLIDGGALSVFQDCMDTLIESKYINTYDVTILVGKRSLFEKYSDRVTIIEFPKSKKAGYIDCIMNIYILESYLEKLM